MPRNKTKSPPPDEFTLEDLTELEYQVKYLGSKVPVHARVRTRFNDRSANGLTTAIETFVRLRGGYAKRLSSEGRYRPGEILVNGLWGTPVQMKGKWLPGLNAGMEDVRVQYRNKYVAVEIKMPGDRPRPSQVKFRREFERGGGIYIIVENWQDFWEAWKKIFKKNV